MVFPPETADFEDSSMPVLQTWCSEAYRTSKYTFNFVRKMTLPLGKWISLQKHETAP